MRRSDRNGEWFEGDTPPPLDLDGVDPNAIIISKTRQANICVQCGDQFFPQRKATKYCSGHCRRQVLKKYHQKVYEKRREDQARLEYLEEVVGGTSTDTETVSPSLR